MIITEGGERRDLTREEFLQHKETVRQNHLRAVYANMATMLKSALDESPNNGAKLIGFMAATYFDNNVTSYALGGVAEGIEMAGRLTALSYVALANNLAKMYGLSDEDLDEIPAPHAGDQLELMPDGTMRVVSPKGDPELAAADWRKNAERWAVLSMRVLLEHYGATLTVAERLAATTLLATFESAGESNQ